MRNLLKYKRVFFTNTSFFERLFFKESRGAKLFSFRWKLIQTSSCKNCIINNYFTLDFPSLAKLSFSSKILRMRKRSSLPDELEGLTPRRNNLRTLDTLRELLYKKLQILRRGILVSTFWGYDCTTLFY